MICLNCKKETNNKKYCSKSCSAVVNNKIANRRKLEGKCKDCNKIISTNRKYCKDCLLKNHRVNYSILTLKELSIPKGNRNSYHTVIRIHARKIANQYNLLKECSICKYNFYVECCHIKSISSFPKNTQLDIINSKENLIGLCPNHHKELDKGFLKL